MPCQGVYHSSVVASQDWPEVTKYAGLVCAQGHRQELIQDLFKDRQDPQRGTVAGGMIRWWAKKQQRQEKSLNHRPPRTGTQHVAWSFRRLRR
ncbi:hypothetical protein BHE74_00032044 [Ensete ventricosum]|nr:hypothetical protein BHE74_00032044 [Ensete ventricosum]